MKRQAQHPSRSTADLLPSNEIPFALFSDAQTVEPTRAQVQADALAVRAEQAKQTDLFPSTLSHV
jgi:hypothetical protein